MPSEFGSDKNARLTDGAWLTHRSTHAPRVVFRISDARAHDAAQERSIDERLTPERALNSAAVRGKKNCEASGRFHRAIGQPVVLDKADELCLLYYVEPGNYRSAGADPFAQTLAREKLLRMVRRDRSHSKRGRTGQTR